MPTILEQPREATESGGTSFILLFICTGCKISVVNSCGFIYLFYQIGSVFHLASSIHLLLFICQQSKKQKKSNTYHAQCSSQPALGHFLAQNTAFVPVNGQQK
jgi:hypothetical protein